jgi:hypothetical protein
VIGIVSFFLESNQTGPFHPVAPFEIRRLRSQWDNQGLCKGTPQKVESENPWHRPIISSVYATSPVWNSP